MGVVELEIGAYVDHERRPGRLLDLAWGERVHVDALDLKRAAVAGDDGLEVRGLRREARGRLLHELVLVGDLEHRGVRALVADR